MAGSEFVSVSELAEAFGCHPKTVREWGRSGRLPTAKTPGGQRKFIRAELERILLDGGFRLPASWGKTAAGDDVEEVPAPSARAAEG